MNRQGPALFEAPLAHETGACTCQKCRAAREYEREPHMEEWEAVGERRQARSFLLPGVSQTPSLQRPVLRRGSRGRVVQELQIRLNVWLMREPRSRLQPLTVDGIFGPLTEAAVRAYQKARGLRIDGIVGQQAWGSLLQLNPPPGSPARQLLAWLIPINPVPVPSPLQQLLSVPSLIKTERIDTKPPGPPDFTLFVNIPLGGEGRATTPMTGIYIPDNYKLQPQVDMILYLHGFKTHKNQATPRNPKPEQLPDPGETIDQYLAKPLRAFREGVNTSGKNVILVAPTLGQFSKAGWLSQPGGLDLYINQVMAALTTYGPYNVRGTSTPKVGNIILAAHSGGGKPMREIIGEIDAQGKVTLSKQRFTPNIRECWGFDCMYDPRRDPEVWAAWARTSPNVALHNYYRDTVDSGTKRPINTKPASDALEGKKLPNVFSRPLPPDKYVHDDVPLSFWRFRVMNAGFLSSK